MASTAARSLNRFALRSLPSLAFAQQPLSSAFLPAAAALASAPPAMSRPSVAPRARRLLSAAAAAGREEGNDVAGAMAALARADAVCFDVDSTVIDEEGIDVLADTLGKGPEVAAWTAKAMEGDTKVGARAPRAAGPGASRTVRDGRGGRGLWPRPWRTSW